MSLGQKIIVIIALAAISVVFISALLMTLTCFCGLACLCSPEPDIFTLVIKGTPSDARVFVNETEFPAPQENGEIKLEYLKSNIVHNIRISHERYEDFVFTVTGETGEIKEFTVQLIPVQDTPYECEPY